MYLLRGTNELGDPVDLPVDVCWRCGALVHLTFMPLDEHVDRCHPPALPAEPRHALRDDRRVDPPATGRIP